MPILFSNARTILRNPQPDHSPGLRLIAWAALKAERGQTVRQARLQQMARAGRATA